MDKKALAKVLIVLHYLVLRGKVDEKESDAVKAYLGRLASRHEYVVAVYGAALGHGVIHAAEYGITIIPVSHDLHEEYKKQINVYADEKGIVRIEDIISE